MRKKRLFISVILLAAVLLSGCTGAIAWPGLSATDEVAYLANTNAVYAIDLTDDGKELWSFSGEGGSILSFGNPSLFVSTPVVTPDGLVIILDSSNKHIMYAVDPNNYDASENKPKPRVEWTFSDADGLWIAPPLVIGDRLFAPNSDGNVYILDLQDGKSEKSAIKVISVSESQEEARLWAQPVTDGERVYITSLDKSVIGIDLETYKFWHEDIGGAVPGGAVLGGDGMLYVGSLAKQLERFDPVTGAHEPVLDKEIKGWIWGTPATDGDNLYFGDIEGYFYSYNTAEQKLNFDPLLLDGSITSSPIVLDDRVLVATESGKIFSIAADGSYEAWFEPDTKGKAYTTPVFAGGFVLVAYLESDYYLVALDEDGKDQWTYPGE